MFQSSDIVLIIYINVEKTDSIVSSTGFLSFSLGIMLGGC